MKNILKLLKYTLNYKKEVCLNILFNVLYVFFNLFSFVIVVPFVSVLFGLVKAPSVCPDFALSKDALVGIASYWLNYSKETYGFVSCLAFLCIGFFVFTLLANLFRYLGFWFLEPIRSGITKDIRNDLYKKLTSLHVSFFSDKQRGDIISRMTSDVSSVEWSVFTCLQMVIKDPVMIIVYTLTLLFVSWKFVVLIIIVLPLPMLLIKKIGESLSRNSYKAQKKIGALISFAEEAISMVKVTKSMNAERIMAAKFQEHNTSYTETMTKVIGRQELAAPLTDFFSIAVLSFIVLIGGMMVLNSQNGANVSESFALLNIQMEPATLIAFTLLFSRLISPVKELITAYYNLKKGEAAAERINQLMDSEEKIDENKQNINSLEFQNEIRFENVGFSYENNDGFCLENISFTIKKGQRIAIVGASGAGKSTLFDLLIRFADATSGKITIDNTDIRDFNLKTLRSLYGMVTQESILFNDSIKNNVAFGLENVNDEDIIKACEIANATEFIEQMTDGYDTVTGDRGTLLSGGQKQRLCIARAVLRNPQILLMDEATSAMDTQNEHKVTDAISNAMQGRTMVVIAHRLSTVINSDLIIVMDKGKIVETGTHRSLLEKNGHYSKLIKLQTL